MRFLHSHNWCTLTPAGIQVPCSSHSLTPHHPNGMEERMGGMKKMKMKNELKQKLHKQTKQNKEFIHHFPWTSRCSAIPRKARLHHMQQLLGKTKAITPNIPSVFLALALYAELYMIPYSMEYLESVEVSCPCCVPFCPHSLLTGGVGWKAEKASTVCKHWSALTKISLNYQHCF